MHIRGSVRELEGALVKLAALAALDGGPVTLAAGQRGPGRPPGPHRQRRHAGRHRGGRGGVLRHHAGRHPLLAPDADGVAGPDAGHVPGPPAHADELSRRSAGSWARTTPRSCWPSSGWKRCSPAKDRLDWMTPAGPKSMPAAEAPGAAHGAGSLTELTGLHAAPDGRRGCHHGRASGQGRPDAVIFSTPASRPQRLIPQTSCRNPTVPRPSELPTHLQQIVPFGRSNMAMSSFRVVLLGDL